MVEREETRGCEGTCSSAARESWRIKAYVGRDEKGAKRYVSRTVRGTKRDAEKALTELVLEVDQGRYIAAAPLTCDELLDRWLKVKRRNVEASTIRSYTWLADTYLRPVLGERNVSTIRPMELDHLYSMLDERGLSPRTVRMCHTIMRQSRATGRHVRPDVVG